MERAETRIPRIVDVFLALVAAACLVSCSTTKDSGKEDAVSGASPADSGLASVTDEIPAAGGKRVLVVYFSQGVSTKRVAEDLAAIFSADLERVIEKKPRPSGFFGFMGAGMDSSLGRATPIETPLKDPSGYDLVIACTPVWAWHLAPPMRSWLKLMRARLPDTAFAIVSGDTKPDKIIKMMTDASGKAPLASSSFVERDFDGANRSSYLKILGDFADSLR